MIQNNVNTLALVGRINVSIMGAMLYLVAFGPGAWSVEKK